MRIHLIRSLLVCLLVLLSASGPLAQATSDPQYQQRRNTSPLDQQFERDRLKRENKDRQQRLKDDTDKLFDLAKDLKDKVDKTNEHVLSLEVVRTCEQVEKLAKSIREKMKDGVYVPADSPTDASHR